MGKFTEDKLEQAIIALLEAQVTRTAPDSC